MLLGSYSKPAQHSLILEPPLRADNFPSTPGKVKMERNNYFGRVTNRWNSSTSSKFLFWAIVCVGLMAIFVFRFTAPVGRNVTHTRHSVIRTATRGGATAPWENQVWQSCLVKREQGFVVLVTGAAGFVGSHVSLFLKKRGDGVLGIDNFNHYYEPLLKRSRQALLAKHGIFVVEGDINDRGLLMKLFKFVPFTHVMHLAAQAGVRYAMENPASYVRSNIAGLVSLFETCKSANPQPAIIWASSSSVYGLNSKVPFSEIDRTDQPASLYAATKKAGEEIAHSYNHIYGLSMTCLRFFTVYGPWGRPDMAYFSFTRDILQGKPIDIYQGENQADISRDFTYVDDIVKGCVAALDTAGKSTGSEGKKKGPAQFRVYNLGNTSPVSVADLVDILEGLLKVKARRNLVKMPHNGDVSFTHANVTLAKTELGYNPTTNLQTGLKKFVKWYRSYYHDLGPP
eukprot:c22086_g1_i3 orf=175-1539(-)